MYVNHYEHLFILFFQFILISNISPINTNIIDNNNVLQNIHSLNTINDNRHFNKNETNNPNSIISFANKKDNKFVQWIEDNLTLFCILVVIVVIIIIVIIVLIICCRKMNKKYNELQLQVNKISFQADTRETRQTEDNDRLI